MLNARPIIQTWFFPLDHEISGIMILVELSELGGMVVLL